jgi:hypothetical protein
VRRRRNKTEKGNVYASSLSSDTSKLNRKFVNVFSSAEFEVGTELKHELP